jgi:hypothetical protein
MINLHGFKSLSHLNLQALVYCLQTRSFFSPTFLFLLFSFGKAFMTTSHSSSYAFNSSNDAH